MLTMIIDKTITEFMDELASSAPYPGGGGAAALAGAVGIALGNMTGSLTAGKKKYADVEEDILALNAEAKEIRAKLLSLIDADAEAFAPLSEAYRMPKETPGYDEIMESALRKAASVPAEVMRTCGRAMDVIREYAEKGSRLALSDAGCGAECCRAAMKASLLNVHINTKLMKDREYADRLNAEADELLEKYNALADEIFESVESRLR